MNLLFIGILSICFIVGLFIKPVIALAVLGVFLTLCCFVELGRRISADYGNLKEDVKRLDKNMEKIANIRYSVFELNKTNIEIANRIRELNKRVDRIE